MSLRSNMEKLRGEISNRSLLARIETILSGRSLTKDWVRKRRREQDQAFVGHLLVRCTMPTTRGNAFELVTLELSLLLARVVNESVAFQDAVLDAVARNGVPTPQAPWDLILGFDEFIPGNQFRPDSGRKTMVCSFFLKQLGHKLIARDESWFSPLVVLSEDIKTIEGGFPRVLSWLLNRVRHGPQNMRSVGASTMLRGRPFMIFADVSAIISDNDGIRMGLGLRGSAGLRPCIRCANVWKKNSVEVAGGMVDITCADVRQLVPTDAKHLDDAVDALREARILAAFALATNLFCSICGVCCR